MSKQKITDVRIRWMIRRNMPEVLDIERESFEYAWTEEEFLCCLRHDNCIGMVSESLDKISGFMIYELLKGELHVLNFCVAPWMRRQNVGRQMVEKLVAKLSQQRRQVISLEVRESNLDAQLFFRSVGFMATGVNRAFYDDTDEDAFRFEYWLGVK
jgi:ribosomal-protein-alanine N-acetyltransferase